MRKALLAVLMALVAVGIATTPGPVSARHHAASGNGSPIQHVVVLYQENHTFDDTLGYWCAQVTTETCNGMPATVTLKGGKVVRPTVEPDIVPGVAHSVAAQQTAIDGGLMDGWAGIAGCSASSIAAHNLRCIAGYEPPEPVGCLPAVPGSCTSTGSIPNLISLASRFAISDATFSMTDSPSWGGHLYAVAQGTDGFTGDNPTPAGGTVHNRGGWGCDSNKVTNWIDTTGTLVAGVPSCVPDYSLPAAKFPNGGAFKPTPVQPETTILNELDTAGLNWKLYATSGSSGVPAPGTPQGNYKWAICPNYASCLYTSEVANMVPTTNVLSDAAAGTLPAFSVVLPSGSATSSTSQHNGTSMLAGDNWIGQVVSAIENGPNWATTAIFITYDDCGCFYDHVAPPLNPDGTQQGPRSPMVIVSPYAIAGFVDHTPATFIGILAYVEQNYGLPTMGPNDAAAYPFSNAFDYSQVPLTGPRLVQSPLPLASRNLTTTGDDT